MCIFFCSINEHRKYPFIGALNRDEFYSRPTRQAGFWPQNPALLAGKDLEGQGTWLGVSRAGYFGLVTNFRDPKLHENGRHSRGEIVLDYLEEPGKAFLDRLDSQRKNYNPFSFLGGDFKEMSVYTSTSREMNFLSTGVYGLSNGEFKSHWPKVQKGKQLFIDCLKEEEPIDSIFEMMMDNTQYSDERLPDTGVGLAAERMLSSIFIKSEKYGTRSTTVFSMSREGEIRFTEKTHIPILTSSKSLRDFSFFPEKNY